MKPTPPTYVVVLHNGDPKGFWRSIYQGHDETFATATYKDCVHLNPSAGGVRLLKEGKPIRYAGEMGKGDAS